MKEIENSATCEGAGDLVSVLYGEANERERREFELHVKHCASCRDEFAGFVQVRAAIGEWRDEALHGFVSSPAVATPLKKSAEAALRQFFDLSPLWMKGAVAFAALVFCVLLVLAFGRLSSSQKAPQVAVNTPRAVYTKEDVDQAVNDALAKQAAVAQSKGDQRVVEVRRPKQAVTSRTAKSATVAKSAPRLRRPFSRAEREQLAAELRLLTTNEENDLESPDK